MNIENLELKTYKNYKELCNTLNLKVVSGKSKQLQLIELERYCEYHKEGQKIIIDKVYKKPKEKMKSKTNSGIIARIKQGEYSKEMFPLVKNFVANSPNLEYISKGRMLKILGLKNNNYDIARKYPKEVAKYLSDKLKLEISKDDIEIITFAIYENANDKINNAFKNLEKMKYIYSYSDKLLTTYFNYKINIPTINDAKIIEETMLISRIEVMKKYLVDKNEISEFDDYIKMLKDEHGNDINKINKELKIQVFLRGLSEEVRNMTIENLKQEMLYEKVDNYFYSYSYIRSEDINWNDEIITKAQEQLHLENYKSKVKNDYLSSTFAKKITKDIKNKNSFKTETIIRKELIKHLEEFKEKSDVLFDVFTSETSNITINIFDIFKDENIPF